MPRYACFPLSLFSEFKFSIETKHRKGSLLNDENRGNISLYIYTYIYIYIIWKYDLGFGIVV